ncbi:hypothetical protein CR3_gp074 [Cronobacter phage CR3]|uniref:Uncharacterized protein n=1 Tax=Cronobacter phage CR3 TaxID=1162295 RepID=I1TRB6_9CAUD|nr:hypothetical protein CR3_gp074 [Cronobacter phage CR3]AFH21239.1 hypothetical protein CR3_074 [Cronobacter phage CR3]
MIKLLVPVVRDMVAEREGIESLVGKQVEIVKKIPKHSRITVATPGMGQPKTFPVNKDVYLVNAEKSRFMSTKGRCDPVMVLFRGYEGNDIYSAEELGL